MKRTCYCYSQLPRRFVWWCGGEPCHRGTTGGRVEAARRLETTTTIILAAAAWCQGAEKHQTTLIASLIVR